jgi:hypothetical protein
MYENVLNLTFMQGMPFIFPSQAALYNAQWPSHLNRLE